MWFLFCWSIFKKYIYLFLFMYNILLVIIILVFIWFFFQCFFWLFIKDDKPSKTLSKRQTINFLVSKYIYNAFYKFYKGIVSFLVFFPKFYIMGLILFFDLNILCLVLFLCNIILFSLVVAKNYTKKCS